MLFSTDGTQIITSSFDDLVKIWDAESGDELASLPGHTRDLRALALSPDGEALASGAGDRTVLVRRFYPDLEALERAAQDFIPKAIPQVSACPANPPATTQSRKGL
jgi:WD40 repeat protein